MLTALWTLVANWSRAQQSSTESEQHLSFFNLYWFIQVGVFCDKGFPHFSPLSLQNYVLCFSFETKTPTRALFKREGPLQRTTACTGNPSFIVVLPSATSMRSLLLQFMHFAVYRTPCSIRLMYWNHINICLITTVIVVTERQKLRLCQYQQQQYYCRLVLGIYLPSEKVLRSRYWEGLAERRMLVIFVLCREGPQTLSRIMISICKTVVPGRSHRGSPIASGIVQKKWKSPRRTRTWIDQMNSYHLMNSYH